MALLLALHAARHQGRLGGVEAGNGTAGHRDEHEAPDGGGRGVHIVQMGPDFGDGEFGVGVDAHDDTNGHDDQADAEQRINLADDLINGNEGSDEVIDENQHQPEQGGGQEAGRTEVLAQGDDQAGRAHRKDGAHHDQQHHREHTHDVLHGVAQIFAGHFGDGAALVAFADHTGEVVMNAAGKDGAEGDPQEHDGSPQSTLHGAEDRSQASNVQQLDQEQLPLGHHDIVNTVIDAHGGSFAIVRAKGVVHHFTVGKVADHQNGEADNKTYHKDSSLYHFSTVSRSAVFTMFHRVSLLWIFLISPSVIIALCHNNSIFF